MSAHGRFRLAMVIFLATFVTAGSAFAGSQFRRGDCNDDGEVNLTDGIVMLDLQFGGSDVNVPCRMACDFNASGGFDVTTAVYIFFYLFGGGAPPPAPFPGCGSSVAITGPKDLGCETSQQSCPQMQAEPLLSTLYLPFEGTFQDVFCQRDGTGVGGASFSSENAFGDDGQSLLLDGIDDRVVIPGDRIDLRHNHTISVWIKTDATDVNGVIFADGYGEVPFAGSRILYVRKGDGRLIYYTEDTWGMTSNVSVNDGQWHHVIILHNYTDPMVFATEEAGSDFPRRRGGTSLMFIDGVNQHFYFDLWQWRMREGSGDFHIGGVPQGAASYPDFDPENPGNEMNHFRGNIDEFRVFNGEHNIDPLLDFLGSGELISCDPDDTSVAGITVTPVDDGRANVFKVTAEGAQDASGDDVQYTFFATQLSGPKWEHGPSPVIGMKQTPYYLEFVEGFDAEEWPGNEVEFTLSEGEWRFHVEVTDADSYHCQGQPGEGLEDNTATYPDTIVIDPLPGGGMKRSDGEERVALWIEAEDYTLMEPFETDRFWRTQDNPGGFGGQVLSRGVAPDAGPGDGGVAPGLLNDGRHAGVGSCGGRLTYEFDIGDAGGAAGTYYIWFRSVNPFNMEDFLVVDGDPDDADVPVVPGEDGLWYGGGCENGGFFSNGDDRVLENDAGPAFFWLGSRRNGDLEGHEKELQDGDNAMHIFHSRGGAAALLDVILITDDPEYVPTDEDYLNAVSLEE